MVCSTVLYHDSASRATLGLVNRLAVLVRQNKLLARHDQGRASHGLQLRRELLISMTLNCHNLETCSLQHGMARRITLTRSLQGCPGLMALWPEQAVPLNDDIVDAIRLSALLVVRKPPAKGAASTAHSQSVVATGLLSKHLRH